MTSFARRLDNSYEKTLVKLDMGDMMWGLCVFQLFRAVKCRLQVYFCISKSDFNLSKDHVFI